MGKRKHISIVSVPDVYVSAVGVLYDALSSFEAAGGHGGSYEGVEDHVRQEDLWGLLIDNFTDDEHGQVGFVFTHTPEEKAEIDRGAASGARACAKSRFQDRHSLRPRTLRACQATTRSKNSQDR
jgi:hypothetical protein